VLVRAVKRLQAIETIVIRLVKKRRGVLLPFMAILLWNILRLLKSYELDSAQKARK
jgi:hypothetical protein